MQKPYAYSIFQAILTFTVSTMLFAVLCLSGTRTAASDSYFLGIDIGGRDRSEAQRDAEYDYLSLCCQAGLRTVGQEFVSWSAIEPAPAHQGIHTYEWSALDQDVTQTEAAGGRLSLTLIPDADWAVEVTQAESSPPKDGAMCASANPEMGMSCWQAWSDFVGAVVERYDNDGVNDMPSLQYAHLHYQIGTEYENTEQWNTADGTQRVEKYTTLLQTAHQAAKQANAEAKIISFSFNFGDGFDNNPTVQTFNNLGDPIATGRREFTAQVLQQATDYFDIVGTNVNFHYNGIPARVRWIRSYVDKPIFLVDAATARLLDRRYLQPLLYDETVYPYMTETQIGEILVQRDHAEHVTVKTWWEKEKAKYSIKKAVIAASQGVENIGFQFMFDTMGSNNFWGTISEMAFNIACGVLEWGFDYEPMGTAKPVYYTLRLFDERVGGFDSVNDLHPLPAGSDPTEWTWSIKFTKENRDIFVLWSESGPQTLDMSSYFLQPTVTLTHIVTELDESSLPVYPDDQTVQVSSIPVDEVPVFVQQTGEYHHVPHCTVCHYGGDSSTPCQQSANLGLVRDTIEWPLGSDPKTTVFGPYVTGAPLHNGICEACHTGTAYYRNNDTGGVHPVYKPGAMGPTECNLCHKHAPYEFGHGGAVGTGCDACHGQAGGAGTARSHATHTKIDEAKGPHVGCPDCHDTNNFPNFADGEASLAATEACDGCHSPGGAFDGVAMAKGNWEEGIYEADGTTLKAGKEQWCAACHDIEPANSKADGSGVDAPKVAGDNATWGFYATGHGKRGWVVCLDCHDTSTTHIDNEHRTYDHVPGTGVINPYGAGYRLKMVAGNEAMNIPRPLSPDVYEYLNDFALCVSCHNPYEVLGQDLGLDPNGKRYYDVSHTNFWNTERTQRPLDWEVNTHTEHLEFSGMKYDSDFDGVYDSRASCVACHNVHGSDNDAMIRKGDLIRSNDRAFPDGFKGLGFFYLFESAEPVASATWAPDISEANEYYVYGWWADSINWAKNATYTINYSEGSETIEVNQEPGSAWNALSTTPLPFAAGTSSSVVLTNEDTRAPIVADAVGWDSDGFFTNDWDGDGVNDPDLVINDGTPEFTLVGTGWNSTARDDSYNDDHYWHPTRTPSYAEGPVEESIGGVMVYEKDPDNPWGKDDTLWSNGVCISCHYDVPYYRTPFVGPKVLKPKAEPENLVNDGLGSTVLSTSILDHDDDPPSINTSINLAPLGGLSNQQMYDDGTHGDAVAGDAIFSFRTTTTIPEGEVDLEISASDDAVPANTGTHVVRLYVVEPDSLYIDNSDGGPTFALDIPPGVDWNCKDVSGANKGNHCWIAEDSSVPWATATWSFDIPEGAGGNYKVYGWWESQSNWASNAKFTIHYDGGSDTVEVNQKPGSAWDELTSVSYPFAGGTSGSVVLTNEANGPVVADGIKLKLQP
jgi:hypothetical protein